MSHTIPLNLDLSDGVLIGIALGLFCAVVVFLFAYTGRRNK